ncbi:hypothetical protein D3C76_1559900 [compost metagenome]
MCRGAVVHGPQAGGQAHVAGKRMDVLLIEVGLPGLPAETAHDRLAQGVVPDLVGATANAITVAVVRVGVGQNRGLRDGLKQAQANHWRGNPGGKPRVRVHRAIP